jgi:hypothetical protein
MQLLWVLQISVGHTINSLHQIGVVHTILVLGTRDDLRNSVAYTNLEPTVFWAPTLNTVFSVAGQG